MLQGVCSPFWLTTPIIGLAMSASSRPIARMKARCGARSSPSVVTRDRSFFIPKCLRKAPRPSPERALVRFRAPLLEWRHDRRMLELGDIHLRQHAGLGIDVEHLLDRREIRRSAGIAAEIIA